MNVHEIMLREVSLPLLVQVVESAEETLDLGGAETGLGLDLLHLLWNKQLFEFELFKSKFVWGKGLH